MDTRNAADQRSEHADDRVSRTVFKSRAGFHAELPGLDLATLIQMACARRERLVVRVSSYGEEGFIFSANGRLHHATLGEQVGDEAVLRMLTWTSGEFAVCERPFPIEPTIEASTESLLLRAVQRIDESARDDALSTARASGQERVAILPGVPTAGVVHAAIKGPHVTLRDDDDDDLPTLIPAPRDSTPPLARESSPPAAKSPPPLARESLPPAAKSPPPLARDSLPPAAKSPPPLARDSSLPASKSPPPPPPPPPPLATRVVGAPRPSVPPPLPQRRSVPPPPPRSTIPFMGAAPRASGLGSQSEPRAHGLGSQSEPRAPGLSPRAEPRAYGLASQSEPRAPGFASQSEPRAHGLGPQAWPGASTPPAPRPSGPPPLSVASIPPLTIPPPPPPPARASLPRGEGFRDVSLIASVRVDARGELVDSFGGNDMLPQLVAYVARVIALLRVDFSLAPFEALHAELSGLRVLLYEDAGDMVGLMMRPGDAVQELRQRLGV